MSTPQFLYFSARGKMIAEFTSILQDRTVYLKLHQSTGEGVQEKPFFLSFREEHVHDWLDYVRTGDKTKLTVPHIGFLNRLAIGSANAPVSQSGERKTRNEGDGLHELMAKTINDASYVKTGNGTYIYTLTLPKEISSLPFSAQKKLAGTFNVRGLQLQDEDGSLILFSSHYLDLNKGVLELKPLSAGRS